MEKYEEQIFDKVRSVLMECSLPTSYISSGSGVSYYTIVNIKKNNKERKYLPETYGKLKKFFIECGCSDKSDWNDWGNYGQ